MRAAAVSLLPLQGGGREGGPAPARGWAAAGHPPRPPFQGGEERAGRPGCGDGRETPRPVCGAWGIPPPDLPPSRGEERRRRGQDSPASSSLDEGADRRRFLSSPLQGGGREGGPAPARGWAAAGHPPRPPFQGGEERAGRPGRGGGRETPVRSAEPGASPLPTSPLPGGRSEDGADRTLRHRRRRTKERIAAVFSPPPFRGEVGRGVPRRRARRRRVIPPGPPSRGEKRGRGGRGAEAVGRPPVRSAEPGSPPLPTSPLPGGRSADGADRTLRHRRRWTKGRIAAVFSPPPFRGEVGRGVPPPGAPPSRRPRAKRERGCGPSARQAGGTPVLPGNSRMSGIGKIPVRGGGAGSTSLPTSPLKGGGAQTVRTGPSGIIVVGRRDGSPPFSLLPPGRGRSADDADGALRHHRRTKGRIAAVFSPPPFRGEVGRGVPPPGAPASRRPRAKRERGCGPSARQAGGTPALPGGSRTSGVGKIPVRSAEPPGQPPSRPPP